jgi:hypothetical protein
VESQNAEQKNNNAVMSVSTTLTRTFLTDSPVELRTPAFSKQSTSNSGQASRSSQDPPTPPRERQTHEMHTGPSTDRAIGHIEHYAHTTDFVALWGVLHFVTNKMASPMLPRFIGRVFSRTSSRGGHQLCQHYLDGMFPLEKGEDGHFIGCKENNEFMESIVEIADSGTELKDLREGIENNWALIEGRGESGLKEVAVHGSFHGGKLKSGDVRVKDLSRLWLYRNGKSPPEVPPGLQADSDGVVRAGTL